MNRIPRKVLFGRVEFRDSKALLVYTHMAFVSGRYEY